MDMKSQIKTRYIGNSVGWIEFWESLGALSSYSPILDFISEEHDRKFLEHQLQMIDKDMREKREFYQQKIIDYGFKISPSFSDMWLSGSVDKFETIYNFISGYRDCFEVNKLQYYFKLFLNPKNIFRFENTSQHRDEFEELYSVFPFILEKQDWSEIDRPFPTPQDFYTYPNDGYLNPLALQQKSVASMFLICEGEIEVNGGALFMFADEPFADGEYEIGIYSYGEATWQRYQTIPEPFLYTLAYVLFEAEVHSVDDLLKVNDVFKLLYK